MLQVIEEFLSQEECEELIMTYQDELTPAMVGIGRNRRVRKSRVALNHKIREDTPLTKEIKNMTAQYAGCDSDCIEDLEIIKYEEGGHFKCHHDGGNRSYSLYVCLNDEYVGGDCVFPSLDHRFHLPSGTALLWENTSDAVHTCEPVTEGEKWLLVAWVRRPDQGSGSDAVSDVQEGSEGPEGAEKDSSDIDEDSEDSE